MYIIIVTKTKKSHNLKIKIKYNYSNSYIQAIFLFFADKNYSFCMRNNTSSCIKNTIPGN